MSNLLISVLITVYNREKYIAAAIESVLAQTFPDFELIIVDDGSKDRSVEIARCYEKDPRVRVFVNEHNLGDYPNRNRAASLATGKYLKYVDADDMIYPHCLEMMVTGMESFPEAGFGVSRAIPGVVCPALLSPRDAYLDSFFGSGLFGAGPLDTIIRRSALETMGGFHVGRSTGDFHCWLTLARIAPVAVVVPGLVWYRTHAEQESALLRSPDPEVSAVFAARYYRFALEALGAPDCPLLETEGRIARSRLMQDYSRAIVHRLVRARFRYASVLLHESRQPIFTLAKALLQPQKSEVRSQKSEVRGQRAEPQMPGPISAFQHVSVSAFSPLVSVLIPAYNAEAHLAEAIESVLAQRFTDWELIIVDDASTDRTAEIAQRYADGDRIRFYRNERNLGKWPNHNRCATFAKGNYIKFLHADDSLYPQCLEHMMHFIELYPEAVLLQSHEVNRYLSPKLQTPREVYQQEFFGLVTLRESLTGIMYRSAAWAAAGGYDPQCVSGAAKLHLCMTRAAPALLIYAGLAFYRRGSQQRRHAGPGAILASVGERAWLKEAVRHPQCPLTDTEKREALRNLELLAGGCQSRSRLYEYRWEFWYPLYEATTQFQAGLYPRRQVTGKTQAGAC